MSGLLTSWGRCMNLTEFHAGQTMKASEKLGMSTHTIHDLLEGKSWASYAVIARIEQRLDIDLWSKTHKFHAGMQKRRYRTAVARCRQHEQPVKGVAVGVESAHGLRRPGRPSGDGRAAG